MLMNLSRATIYNYKNQDIKNSIDWDELKFLHATDSTRTNKTEQEFIALLINQFDEALADLDKKSPEGKIATIAKYTNLYYKLKQQRDNPIVSKADIAKAVIEKISLIALNHKKQAVVNFLAANADLIISKVIKQ